MAKWRIIALQGPKGGGKDTICQMIIDSCPLPVKRFAFADGIKDELADEMGMDADIMNNGTSALKDSESSGWDKDHPRFDWFFRDHPKDHRDGKFTYREMMRLWGEMKGTGYWVSKLLGDMYDWLEIDPDRIAVISDVRLPLEVEQMKCSGASMVKILADRNCDEEVHYTEKYEELECDYTIKGRGKSSLKETRAALKDILWSSLGVTI